MSQDRFNIPVVMFIFKRKDTTLRIIERVAEIKPTKLYLLADYGRNEEEKKLADECRRAVEEAINWDCSIIKNYAIENRGVYANIGEGAKWVFEREEFAIFLEDDNLPELTFFEYCRELLEKYRYNSKVLWICGTNYLENYNSDDSYMFTQHLLPCGWASWRDKFLKYYDGEMSTFSNDDVEILLKRAYSDRRLYKHQYRIFEKTLYNMENNRKRCSWDYQMAYTLRYNNLYGISPQKNQIRNIGVDEFSEHGGTTYKNVMTRRFCGIESFPLDFPLNHPKEVACDENYEKLIGNIILPPWYYRIRVKVGDFIKKILGINKNESLILFLRRKK